MGSARSMVISMLVVLVACLAWVAMVPRVSSVKHPVENVPGIAREIKTQTSWNVALPQGLDQQWVPLNVRLVKVPNMPDTWNVGYDAPSGKYLALKQTKTATASWTNSATEFGKGNETVTIAGATWTKVSSEKRELRSLIRQEPLGGLRTIVAGQGSWAELQALATALKPT